MCVWVQNSLELTAGVGWTVSPLRVAQSSACRSIVRWGWCGPSVRSFVRFDRISVFDSLSAIGVQCARSHSYTHIYELIDARAFSWTYICWRDIIRIFPDHRFSRSAKNKLPTTTTSTRIYCWTYNQHSNRSTAFKRLDERSVSMSQR